jgi:NAD(P)-dependent dehydrogenase (short-subunit alcohol dehydrogenase family)
MAKGGGGSIVVTSSTAGIHGYAGGSAYVTSKHAVIGMMRTAALECAPLKIRVNTINPAPIETRMMRSIEEQLAPGHPGQAKEQFQSTLPLGRYERPEEVADVMLFLASDQSSTAPAAFTWSMAAPRRHDLQAGPSPTRKHLAARGAPTLSTRPPAMPPKRCLLS